MDGRGMAMTVIVAYDIASNSRRVRVANMLEGRGYRIQESVFQLRLDRAELDDVRQKIAKLIRIEEDVVHVYPLCSACEGRAEVHGIAPALDDVGLYRGLW